jgi:predicted nucleic acid-binding protein
MTSRIFIDANIPIYAIGRDHPLRGPSKRIIALIPDYPDRFFTSAEVLQELLHRYLSLRIWREARDGFWDFVTSMGGKVESILPGDVEQAARLADDDYSLSARDLIHVAVIRRVGANRIVSADRGFDRVSDIERLDPADVGRWRSLLA